MYPSYHLLNTHQNYGILLNNVFIAMLVTLFTYSSSWDRHQSLLLCFILFDFFSLCVGVYIYTHICIDLRQPAENLLQAPWLLRFGATSYEGCVQVIKEWIFELTNPGYKGEEKGYNNGHDYYSRGDGNDESMDMDYKGGNDYKKWWWQWRLIWMSSMTGWVPTKIGRCVGRSWNKDCMPGRFFCASRTWYFVKEAILWYEFAALIIEYMCSSFVHVHVLPVLMFLSFLTLFMFRSTFEIVFM